MATKNSSEGLVEAEHELKQEINRMTRNIFHRATPSHSYKMRGVGITRKDKSSTKKAVKLAKKQRAVNHSMKNKKFRKTGSNKRK